jgi:uncharacterized membrane protein
VSFGSIVFAFFFIACTGWVLETVQESIVRHKFVSKGFFKGPWVPLQGIGGFAMHLCLAPLQRWPILVFLVGAAVCTVLECIASVFLEKCFNVRCWDYSTYPYTKWCHYKGRICLTFFFIYGTIALFLVYFYWELCMSIISSLGGAVNIISGILLALFFVDVIYTCVKMLRYKKAGIKLRGWAAFTDESKAVGAGDKDNTNT